MHIYFLVRFYLNKYSDILLEVQQVTRDKGEGCPEVSDSAPQRHRSPGKILRVAVVRIRILARERYMCEVTEPKE